MPYINMNPPQVYTCSPSWTLLPPPSPYHPSGLSQCTKRHWCIEQSFGLCGRGRGWDDLGVWHWNMNNIIYETSCQSRFNERYWMLGAGALGWPRGMVWGGRREEGSGWGARVYLWQIHFDVWQNQYNIVKFKITCIPVADSFWYLAKLIQLCKV